MEEHGLSGEELEGALEDEMGPWIEDHEMRLQQVQYEVC